MADPVHRRGVFPFICQLIVCFIKQMQFHSGDLVSGTVCLVKGVDMGQSAIAAACKCRQEPVAVRQVGRGFPASCDENPIICLSDGLARRTDSFKRRCHHCSCCCQGQQQERQFSHHLLADQGHDFAIDRANSPFFSGDLVSRERMGLTDSAIFVDINPSNH